MENDHLLQREYRIPTTVFLIDKPPSLALRFEMHTEEGRRFVPLASHCQTDLPDMQA